MCMKMLICSASVALAFALPQTMQATTVKGVNGDTISVTGGATLETTAEVVSKTSPFVIAKTTPTVSTVKPAATTKPAVTTAATTTKPTTAVATPKPAPKPVTPLLSSVTPVLASLVDATGHSLGMTSVGVNGYTPTSLNTTYRPPTPHPAPAPPKKPTTPTSGGGTHPASVADGGTTFGLFGIALLGTAMMKRKFSP